MRLFATIAVMLFLSVSARAQGPKPCAALKSEISTKLDAKGVTSYSLNVVAKDQDAEGRIVGSCDGGTKKIVYKRTSASATATAKESASAPVATPAKQTTKQ